MRWPGKALASTAQQQWLIGIKPSAGVPSGLLAGHVRRVREDTLSVPAARARAIGGELRRRGLLLYAEPDARMRHSSAPDTNPAGWARGAVVPAGFPNPAAPAEIAIVDNFVDGTHPDLAGHVSYLGGSRTETIDGPHGTEVASAAAAAANGSGVIGVAPGAFIASFGLPTGSRSLLKFRPV